MHSTRPAFGRFALLTLFAALFLGAASPDAAAQDLAGFINGVTKAIDSGDFTGLRSLVDKSKDMSVRTALTFEDWAVKASAQNNQTALDQSLDYMNQLAVTFKLAHDDPFLADRAKWFKKLSTEQLATAGKLQEYLSQGFAARNKAKETANEELWREAVTHFDKLMREGNTLGDYYLAVSGAARTAEAYDGLGDDFARAYYLVWMQEIADKGSLKDDGDRAKNMIAEMKNYDKIKRPDLIKTSLDVAAAKKSWEEAYKKSLVVDVGEGGGNAEGGGALVPPKPEAENEWVEDKGFKATVIKRDKVMLPWTNLREMANGGVSAYPFWFGQFGLKKDTKDQDFFVFGEKATASWDGKLKVDYDGPDGKGKAKVVKLKKGKPVAHKFKGAYEDGSSRKLSVEFYDIAHKIKLFGQQFKYTDEGQLVFYFRSQSGVKGKIRGHDVTIVDTSGDCRFTDYGEDSILIGKGKEQRADPLGRFVYFKQENGWYPYEVKIIAKNGSVVRSRPYSGELAPLRVNFETANGARPEFLVAKGSQEYADFYIDLTRAMDEIVWVPPTSLTIHRGAMTVGSGRNKGSVMIGKGRSRGFKVQTGKMNVWDLCDAGEKGCWLEGKVVRDLENNKDLKAEGKFVKVYGNFGEEYHNFIGGRFAPNVEVRKESGEGSRVARAEMKIPKGNGFQLGQMFFPQDTRMKGAYRRGVDMVAQFSVKHPIFGEMESEWIKVEN